MKFALFALFGVIVLAGLFAAFKPSPSSPAADPLAVAPRAPAASTPTAPASSSVDAASIASSPSASASAARASASAVPASANASAAPSTSATDPALRVVRLVVAEGRLVEGPVVVRAVVGERLRLEVTADVADELHLHGYDLRLRLRPKQTASLEFTARRSGRFTYELHRKDLELGALEVYPRGSTP